MKNVQLIDGAANCAYDIFAISDDDFALLFPEPGQDIEFAEDFFVRLGDEAARVYSCLWHTRLDKSKVNGIHGTLFCGLEQKKKFYPSKRESEMTTAVD